MNANGEETLGEAVFRGKIRSLSFNTLGFRCLLDVHQDLLDYSVCMPGNQEAKNMYFGLQHIGDIRML